MPDDLTEAFVTSLELLMLAQAQECVWQKAVLGQRPVLSYASLVDDIADNYKNGLIAKLSMKVTGNRTMSLYACPTRPIGFCILRRVPGGHSEGFFFHSLSLPFGKCLPCPPLFRQH